MKLDVVIDSTPSSTVRAQQLSAAFDVPAREHERLSWQGELPLDERPWHVGLIVGPSGSGKTTLLRHGFGEPQTYNWQGDAVVDDFPSTLSVQDLAAVCGAVGFNTIPAWLRPYHVLSTGEQFRVTLARTLVEVDAHELVVIDEFTSVVDRQVAQIGAHAVQRYVRKHDRKLVAATCHYDVIDWLQPDWTFEPATMLFQWRYLRRRPELACTISREPYASWARFAPFHYLTAELSHSAQCYVLRVEGTPAAFAGILHRPHPRNPSIKTVSRLVTLPDWQGIGLAFALVDRVAAAYTALGFDVNINPAHPSLIRSFDRSPVWQLRAKPAQFNTQHGPNSMRNKAKWSNRNGDASKTAVWRQGLRHSASFRYRGAPLALDVAGALCATGTSSKRSRTRASARG